MCFKLLNRKKKDNPEIPLVIPNVPRLHLPKFLRWFPDPRLPQAGESVLGRRSSARLSPSPDSTVISPESEISSLTGATMRE